MTTRIASWSNVLPAETTLVPDQPRVLHAATRDLPCIPRGAGRSFGDAAYVSNGRTIVTRAGGAPTFDAARERVTCDAGFAIGELQRAVDAAGRHLPVFGGTQWATAGGAVACDIHSKNDTTWGSCGNHVAALALETPDGVLRECSADSEPDLFRATVGGMGLTGVIRRVTFRVAEQRPLALRIRARLFASIPEMVRLFEETGGDLAVVEWVDLGRSASPGIFWYATEVDAEVREPRAASTLRFPVVRAFNAATVRALELATISAARRLDLVAHRRRFHYGSAHEFFTNWNALFGARGFIEYHFAVPSHQIEAAFTALRDSARAARAQVWFCAGKKFGAMPRAGLLSFPRSGFGLNFQTPDTPASRRWLHDFTETLISLDGSVYLAKDSVVTADQYARMTPALTEWQAIARRYDPDVRLQSNLSRRLGLKPW